MVSLYLALIFLILFLDCIEINHIKDGTTVTDISPYCKRNKRHCKDSGFISGRCQETCNRCAGGKADF